ncbi:MAG TPA: addiction module protein [Aestuariivirgaceae bacterium]|nr:addiction module protein [Aestuariivirgaceae bacterium]
MVRSTDTIEAQLLSLPPADRARLAEVLLASLDADVAQGPAAEVEARWRAEGERRLAEMASGKVAGIPAEQVFANVTRR